MKAELRGVAERIEQTVAHSKYSKKVFCQKAKISTTTLRRYIEGEYNPSYTSLVAISVVGEVSLAWLATGEQVNEQDQSGISPAMRLQVRTLAQQSLALIESVEDRLNKDLPVQRKADAQAELIIEGLMTGSYEVSEENVVDILTATGSAA